MEQGRWVFAVCVITYISLEENIVEAEKIFFKIKIIIRIE